MQCPLNPNVYTIVEYDGRHYCQNCRSYHEPTEKKITNVHAEKK